METKTLSDNPRRVIELNILFFSLCTAKDTFQILINQFANGLNFHLPYIGKKWLYSDFREELLSKEFSLQCWQWKPKRKKEKAWCRVGSGFPLLAKKLNSPCRQPSSSIWIMQACDPYGVAKALAVGLQQLIGTKQVKDHWTRGVEGEASVVPLQVARDCAQVLLRFWLGAIQHAAVNDNEKSRGFGQGLLCTLTLLIPTESGKVY